MEIKLNNSGLNATIRIDNNADIVEVLDSITGVLMLEGYDINCIAHQYAHLAKKLANIDIED